MTGNIVIVERFSKIFEDTFFDNGFLQMKVRFSIKISRTVITNFVFVKIVIKFG